MAADPWAALTEALTRVRSRVAELRERGDRLSEQDTKAALEPRSGGTPRCCSIAHLRLMMAGCCLRFSHKTGGPMRIWVVRACVASCGVAITRLKPT